MMGIISSKFFERLSSGCIVVLRLPYVAFCFTCDLHIRYIFFLLLQIWSKQVNKLLHLVYLFRKMCHALFALKGSSYKYFREHRWEKHACILLDYIFQAPSLFGDCNSILFNILCSISDYIVFLSMLIVLEYVSISLIFSEWKLHAIPRSSWNVSFHWAWRIQSKLHENSEVIVVSGSWPPFCLVIFQRAVLVYNFVVLAIGVCFKSTDSKARKIVLFPFLLYFFYLSVQWQK